MSVHQIYRHQGIGTQLSELLKGWVKTIDATEYGC